MSLNCQITNNIARITMDDGKANVMTTEWINIFTKTLDEACASGAKVLLLSGRPKFFSGGLDVKAVTAMDAAGLKKHLAHFARAVFKLQLLPMPTVGLITGHAVAGGFILSSACDFRIGLDGPYKYQLTELALGIALPEWLPIIFEPSLPKPAFESIALSARTLSPQEMKDNGFLLSLDRELSELTARGDMLAAQLAELSTTAYADSKMMMRGARVKQAIAGLE